MRKRADATLVESLRGAIKSHPGASIVQTRLIVSLALLLLAQLTSVFERPTQISWITAGYIALTILLVLFGSSVLEQKRIRAIPILFDILAISFIVAATGGLASGWFVLYLFPVLSASRYLGTGWTVGAAMLAAVSYGVASFLHAEDNVEFPFQFWLRALTLIGVAFTATSLAKTRIRAEAKLISAIERIDQEILSNTDLEQVMLSILNAAMDITDCDLSAIVLIEGEKITATSAAAKRPKGEHPERSRKNESEADGLVRQHYRRVLDKRQPLILPEGHSATALLASMRVKDRVSNWPARLIPLEVGSMPFGVLGVFSRRRFHYFTPHDLRRLASMASLVAMAQKNAKLFRELTSREVESKERLQMLYEIGGQLKAEEALDELFRKVVTLVSNRLGSEEAALFLAHDRGVDKVAVSGPDNQTSERLERIERHYEKGQSLTGKVFEDKRPYRENLIPSDVEYVAPYSEELPSGMTRHYLGVPLLIGDEVLGVIRVLNKITADYSPQEGQARLSEQGFSDEDLDLLTLIATQVASAMRNAKFIERNRYFSNIVYNSPDPIIVIDKDGKVLNFNKECERLWGLTEQEVLGTQVQNYYESPEHAKEVGRALWKAPEHTIWDYKARIKDAKGEIIPIRLSATLLLDKNEQKAGSISVFKDERELLRLEEERIRAGKLAALARLAQTTGHDIKHDVATVLNYVDSLERSANGNPRAQRAYAEIRGATTAVLSKVQNMLMTAKPQAPDKQVVSLKALLRDFEVSISHQAEVSHIEISSNYPQDDPLVLAEPEQMRQILRNFFANSLDAIKQARAVSQQAAGHIMLDVEVEEDFLLISWRDDGCGMPEDARMKAFTPFFTTKETGNGLGLFITKTIIENHGGSVAIESPEGGGVCFRITLPLFRPSASSQAMPA